MNIDPAGIHACVSLIFIKEEKILLQLRSADRKNYPNVYALPAGKVEYSESIFDASIREAKEELDVTLNKSDLVLRHVHYFKHKADEFGLLFFVQVNSWQGEFVNLEPHKHPEMSWFNLSALPKNFAQHHLAALKEIANNVFYSEEI